VLIAVLVALSILYLLIAAYLSTGIHRKYPKRTDLPLVSIVVPARNEEATIADLLESLLQTDYPSDRLEVIIVNDQSDDRTREIAESFQSRFQCRYTIYDVWDEPDGKLIAKTRPLAQGLDRATGEIVLMTDADCVIPPQWVRTMASYFMPNVGMLCGTTLPNTAKIQPNLLTKFETLDWLFLLGSSVGLSGKGHPEGLIGNNYAVRKSVYDAIGTYRALPFTDIDDLALMKAVQRTGSHMVVYPADPGLLIFTHPLRSMGELIRQRRRWLKGITHVDWRGKVVISFGTVMHVSLPAWPLIAGEYSLLSLALLAAADGFILTRMLRHFEIRGLHRWIPAYPVFDCIYGWGIMGLLLRGRKVDWKERKF
jgi:cellulose synthase/poly-beta-1,6-N-acetylglucosamine synthase-like glycosyltransferase